MNHHQYHTPHIRFANVLSILIITTMLMQVTFSTHADPNARHFKLPPKMVYLENDHLKVGVDLNLGGAITYLSDKTHNMNMINSWDWGRQVQMSFYSGPNPYTYGDKKPAKVWAKLGWNPIQVGDHFGHHSTLIEHEITSDELYVKSRPMLWPMNNVPAKCTFEIWLTVNGPAVTVRCKLNNARADKTQYAARHQELPAVYTNAPFYKLITYTGNKPYTHDATTRIQKVKKTNFPWTNWYATEKWAALVNDQGWGVGIYQPDAHYYIGGFAGQPGKGGPKDNPTGYIAPVKRELLDHNIQYAYNYHLLVGNVKTIRDYVYKQTAKLTPPNYIFKNTRLGFTSRNARHAGWPIKQQLHIHLDVKNDPQIESPDTLWYAKDAGIITIHAAFKTKQTVAHVMFKKLGQTNFINNAIPFKIIGDSQFRHYTINLAKHKNYRGLLNKLRIDPIDHREEGAWVKIKSIRASNISPDK